MNNNELTELLTSGFFDDAKFFQQAYISKKGILDLDGVTKLWEAFKGRKYTMKYYLMHGDTIPTWGVPKKYRDPDEAEKLLQECIKEETTWQDKLSYKLPPKNELW